MRDKSSKTDQSDTHEDSACGWGRYHFQCAEREQTQHESQQADTDKHQPWPRHQTPGDNDAADDRCDHFPAQGTPLVGHKGG